MYACKYVYTICAYVQLKRLSKSNSFKFKKMNLNIKSLKAEVINRIYFRIEYQTLAFTSKTCTNTKNFN